MTAAPGPQQPALGSIAVIRVAPSPGASAWPVVERVPDGWQSGEHHYPDADVLDVRMHACSSGPQQPDEVEGMRERLIEFISWGETMEDGRIGYDTARQMMALYDEAVAVRAAAPSAQPDEVDGAFETVRLAVAGGDCGRDGAGAVTADHAGQTGGARDPHWIKDHFDLDGDNGGEREDCASCGHVDFAHTAEGCCRTRCNCDVGWRGGRWITEADRLARRLEWFTDDELGAELIRRRPVPVAGQAAPLGATLGEVTDGQAAREAAVEAVARDELAEGIRDELAQWPIGSGYYATTVSTTDAAEMVDVILPLIDTYVAALPAAPRQEPLVEWNCPKCGATTRARMADHPGQAQP